MTSAPDAQHEFASSADDFQPTFSHWRAFPLSGSVLLEANAGTGKTHALVHWVLRLLIEQAVPIEQVLVVTFTERACQELRDRLTRLLEQAECLLAVDPTDIPASHRDLFDYLTEISTARGVEWLRLRLQLARQSADLAQVRTIHGFCQQALAEFALLQPERVVNLSSLLLESVRQSWRRLLITEQDQALPLHALYAAPEALAAELLPLAEQMLRPPSTRLNLDADKAALLDAAKALLAHQPWLQEHVLDVASAPLLADAKRALAEVLDIARTQTWYRLLRLKPVDLDQYFAKRAKPELIAAPAIQAARAFESQRLDLLPRLRLSLLQQMLTAFWQEREHGRERDRLYCFADFINLMCLRVRHDARFRQALAARYQHCLIDEFQDTDQRQLEIFRRLFESDQRQSPSRLLGMIGDPKQSIYRFRGADLDVYLRQRAEAGVRHGQLSRNFRSRQAVVHAVNRIFAHESAFQSPALRLQPSEAATNPFWQDRCHPDAAAALLQIEIEQSEPLGAAAEWLSQALQQQRFVGAEPLRAADCAILVRRNADAEVLVRALAQRGIAANVRRPTSVLASPAAADLLSLLSALEVEAAPPVRRAAFTTPWLGLDARQSYQLEEATAQDLMQRLLRLRERIVRYGLSSALAEALPAASAEALRMGLGAQWQVDSEHLLSLLLNVSASPAAGLLALQTLQADTIDGDLPENLAARPVSLSDAVTVLTIHAAKGLEFPVVLLPALGNEDARVSKRWQWSRADAPELDALPEAEAESAARAEARRLAYVALTRASMMNVLFQTGDGKQKLLDAVVAGAAPDWQQFVQATDMTVPGLFVRESFSGVGVTRLHSPVGTLRAEARLAPAAPLQVSSFSSLLGRHRLADPGLRFEGPAADEDPAQRASAPRSDPDDETPTLHPELALLADARGTAFGDVVHRLLEAALLSPSRWPSERALQEAQQTLEATESGLAVPRGALAKLLRRVLSTPLSGLPSLAELGAEQFAVEFSFDLRVLAFQATPLAALLDHHGYPDAAAVLRGAEDWSGYLTGSADLLIEHQGRFYVCDYKSNWLGPSLADYRPESLAEAMRAGHYRLQYLIYWLALHRHLQQRLGERYQPGRQIGGALYLFVRAMGLGEQANLGQILEPVAPELVHAMSALIHGVNDHGF